MNNFPSSQEVESVRKQYPAGTRVELISMDDPYNTRLTAGELGTVKGVDDTGTVHIAWDCGSSLGAVYGVDVIRAVS